MASISFGTEYTFADIVASEGMSETCNGLWVGLITLLIGFVYCAIRKQPPIKRMTKKQLLLCVIVGICAAWLCNVFFLLSYHYLSVSEVTMLHFLYPTITTVFMAIAFKERFTLAKAVAILCSIIGMLLVTGGFSGGSVIGMLLAISTGILYAVYPIMV